MTARATARSPLTEPQVTSTGHDPNGAVGSIVHHHATSPAPSAAFGPRPSAALGLDEYVTVIVQSADGTVFAFAIAVSPRERGLVTASVISSAAVTVFIRIGAAVAAIAGADADATAAVGGELPSTGALGTAVSPPHAPATTAAAIASARERMLQVCIRSPCAM